MSFNAIGVLFFSRLLPLTYALLGFGLLITVHECGHFLFCKLFNIHTPTFSIGMGPSLFQRKIGETNFRLSLIPIGGYVEIAGMAEVGQGDQASAHDIGPTSFRSKPYWQRFLVLIGGVLFNLIFAYALFSALYIIGMPVQKEVELVVSRAAKQKTEQTASYLQAGDTLLAVNNRRLSTNPKALYPALHKIAAELQISKGKKAMKVRLLRNKKEIVVTIPAGQNGSNLQRGILAGATVEPKTIRMEYEQYPFFTAIKKGINRTHGLIGQFIASIKMLVKKRNIKDFGGPIMIVSQSFKMAQQGFLWLLVFLALISINLAIINLLPIAVLDGGQLLFETIEAIIRRPIPEMIRFSINLVSWVFLLGLILFLSFQDIVALIQRVF